MSKRREESPKRGAPAWTATFGDLMNLLLCFFVMLFAMSTVDESEWEKLKQSFRTDNTSFLDGGYSILDNSDVADNLSIVETQLENNGASDLEGQGFTEKEEITAGNVEKLENLEESLETIQEQKKLYSEKMYEEVQDMLESRKVRNRYCKLDVDEDFDYIMMTLSGTLLFDSGSIEVKDDVKDVLSKVGDILLLFSGFEIEIIGHTDNVPVSTDKYFYRDNNELSSLRELSTFYYLVNEKGLDPSVIKYSGRGNMIQSLRMIRKKEDNKTVE